MQQAGLTQSVVRPCSVQQRVREGFASEASWSAWLLCSPNREHSAPERRIVQLDVKQRCVVLLHKAVIKHAFQASQVAQLTWAQAVLPAGQTATATRGPDGLSSVQVAEVEAIQVGASNAALVVLALAGEREVALHFQTVHDAALFACGPKCIPMPCLRALTPRNHVPLWP